MTDDNDTATLESVTLKAKPDIDGPPGDVEREPGEVFVGIMAVATIDVCGTKQTIRTPGLWGVSDQSDRDHYASIAADELHELSGILDTLGVERGGPISAEWDPHAPARGTVTVE